MLNVINMSKRYEDGTLAVNKLSMTVNRGKVFGMLGANGAGKTTTLMVALGFTEPTEGTIEICGIDITKDPLEAKKHVAYVSENVMLYGNFTARQNLDFFTKLGGRKDAKGDDYDAVMARVGLDSDCFSKRLDGFSKGMRQKLGIAIAIMKDAQVILLDEPTSGLDPKSGAEFLKLLDELRGEDKAIWMTTHDIFRAREIADRVGIMNKGNLSKIFTRDAFEGMDLGKIYLEYVEQELEEVES